MYTHVMRWKPKTHPKQMSTLILNEFRLLYLGTFNSIRLVFCVVYTISLNLFINIWCFFLSFDCIQRNAMTNQIWLRVWLINWCIIVNILPKMNIEIKDQVKNWKKKKKMTKRKTHKYREYLVSIWNQYTIQKK